MCNIGTKAIFLVSILSTFLFSNSLTIDDKINNISLVDQFDKKHTTNETTKLLIVSFEKDTSVIVNEFLKSKEIDFLTKHNSLFIADISSMPSFVTKLFALPKMRKYNYNVLLIYDEDEKRFIKKEGKLTVYKIDNGVIKSINFINSQEELKSLF